MDDELRRRALILIEREMLVQESCDYPRADHGKGLIEMAFALDMIDDRQHQAYVRLLSSVVEARQAHIRIQLHAQRHGAMEAA